MGTQFHVKKFAAREDEYSFDFEKRLRAWLARKDPKRSEDDARFFHNDGIVFYNSGDVVIKDTPYYKKSSKYAGHGEQTWFSTKKKAVAFLARHVEKWESIAFVRDATGDTPQELVDALAAAAKKADAWGKKLRDPATGETNEDAWQKFTHYKYDVMGELEKDIAAARGSSFYWLIGALSPVDSELDADALDYYRGK